VALSAAYGCGFFGSVLFLPVWVVVFLFSMFPLGWCAVGWVFVGELGKVRRERAATNGPSMDSRPGAGNCGGVRLKLSNKSKKMGPVVLVWPVFASFLTELVDWGPGW